LRLEAFVWCFWASTVVCVSVSAAAILTWLYQILREAADAVAIHFIVILIVSWILKAVGASNEGFVVLPLLLRTLLRSLEHSRGSRNP
jgi:hypothetical protein